MMKWVRNADRPHPTPRGAFVLVHFDNSNTVSNVFLTCGWPKPSTLCSDMPSRTRTRSRRAFLCRVGISDMNQTTQLIRSCDLAICCDLLCDLLLHATTNHTIHLKPLNSHLLSSSRQALKAISSHEPQTLPKPKPKKICCHLKRRPSSPLCVCCMNTRCNTC